MSERSDLRRARLERTSCCEWPGCDVCGASELEMAHLVAVGAGGPDTLDNVRMLCRPHHDLLDGRSARKLRPALVALLVELERLRLRSFGATE